eukprot:gnl/MRDRNA2_/MRDRNA2_103815_c0_seq1.p1 gnl/MRDRNA2_/MRDRNA2_103815_c0~~gnl/MRDRNA2_/MRDRNA2_103815_c0_seq1.p1  ORF type:complete len:343 (-),score=62.86 gnl/MRDRNA2_/MRDRNA2_103815_c0_seq1:183-1211(-)
MNHERDAESSLWSNIRQQLYRSEVPHVKRIVGERRIRRNKIAWRELISLRQILADFETQNDELVQGHELRAKLVECPHRNLLEQQARILLKDLEQQCHASGRADFEIFDNETDRVLRSYILERSPTPSCSSPTRSPSRLSNCSGPTTPSTRPSSACLSRSSGASEDVPCFAKGEPLSLTELQAVAARISEALDEEHLALLAAIEEQNLLLEAEASHQSSAVLRAKAEPSTAELKRFVHRLQELCTSPGLQALAAAHYALGNESPYGTNHAAPATGKHVLGSNGTVRKLRSLIEQTRQAGLAAEEVVMTSPEPSKVTDRAPAALFSAAKCAGSLDPFFDDPFN